MIYKSIQQISCEAAAHHLQDARRMGDDHRIALAIQDLIRVLNNIRATDPEIYSQYVKYLES
jgi:hypothetical protein